MSEEPFRPAYHFTPACNWINDPNGLIWHDGEYHLFFQHNPEGTAWGNMSWGHAVSTDLVHWHELPVALPYTAEEQAFSGSVVLDVHNTSGLGTADEPVMVAIYTSASLATGVQSQSLAYSRDRGRTWLRYPHNPVLDQESREFRDPKVFWYDEGQYWVMVVSRGQDRRIEFYRSADLLTWEYCSDFGPANAAGGEWECPDLFAMPLDDDPDQLRWVLVVSLNPGSIAGGSGTQYFVGSFDGERFVADNIRDSERLEDFDWLDYGADYYAAASFADVPGGERILLGWMNNWLYADQTPTEDFCGSMSLPRTARLMTIGGRPRLVQQPVKSVVSSFTHEVARVKDVELKHGTVRLTEDPVDHIVALSVELEPDTAECCGVRFESAGQDFVEIGFDGEREALYVHRSAPSGGPLGEQFAGTHRAPFSPDDGVVRFTVYVDRASVEVFGGAGEVVITDQVFPGGPDSTLSFFADEGEASLRCLTVSALDAP